MSSSASLEVDLTAFAYGGDAFGRLPDGKAVFVPFGLPGERVRVRLADEKPRYARGELLEVLEPSPERISPRCVHFTTCGGCHYQHMPYDVQLEAKRHILREQLERIGKFSSPPVQPAVPSPRPWNYRNHVQFHLTSQGNLGYHQANSKGVFPIRECHLPEPAINTTWPQLEFETIPGLERIGLRLGIDDDLQLILESEDLQAPELSVEELSISVVHLSPAGSLVLAGSDHVFIEVLGRPFYVSAGSFFQVNTLMAEAMVKHLLENLPISEQATVLDIYCGVGLFSAFLAERSARVIGIESSPQACDDFSVNLDEYDNVELYEAPAEDALPAIKTRPDILLVDPPRSGIDLRALDGILAMRAPFLAYISCDPATLARDGRRLAQGGYRLKSVTPFDLFPQTYHIESISFWER
jgi:23S rRNA (uracil1939-C5)-methyltransferase